MIAYVANDMTIATMYTVLFSVYYKVIWRATILLHQMAEVVFKIYISN